MLPDGGPFVILEKRNIFQNYPVQRTVVPPGIPSNREIGSMDEKEFEEEIERIRQDIEDFPRPYSPCEYFHGREKLFRADQLKEAVEFFMGCQQERFERKGRR